MPAGTAAWITVALCAATAIVFAAQIRAELASEEARASVRAQLERSPGTRAVIPTSAAEMRVFAAVGVTAGICEELLFRGFALWYLSALLPGGSSIDRLPMRRRLRQDASRQPAPGAINRSTLVAHSRTGKDVPLADRDHTSTPT